MNRLEKALYALNFKKIAVWYLVLALVVGLSCIGTVGWLFRERLNFALQYARLEEARDQNAFIAAAQKTADASADVVDVLVLDKSNRTVYSAKNSVFASGTLSLVGWEGEKKYLVSENHPNAFFRYVKSEEFLLSAIINKDFGKIHDDFDDDSFFESRLSDKTVYMLSRLTTENRENTAYVITLPTSVPNGMIALKITALLAALFFGVYWVLVALWIYRDAAQCRLSPLYWGLIGLFTNLIGLIVYKITKRSFALCPVCGSAQNADHRFCAYCGTPLGARCESCGGKVGTNDLFCPHCGHKTKE